MCEKENRIYGNIIKIRLIHVENKKLDICEYLHTKAAQYKCAHLYNMHQEHVPPTKQVQVQVKGVGLYQ